jgi:hypothetical protein
MALDKEFRLIRVGNIPFGKEILIKRISLSTLRLKIRLPSQRILKGSPLTYFPQKTKEIQPKVFGLTNFVFH